MSWLPPGPSGRTQEPKLRYLAKGAVPDHGEERMSSGHRDYDYLEWIARLTSHIPERGTQLVHYYGAYSNAHRGIAFRREAFIEVPPEDDPSDPPQPDSPWLAARRKSLARLIRRVYEVDPFLCRCGERMRTSGSLHSHHYPKSLRPHRAALRPAETPRTVTPVVG